MMNIFTSAKSIERRANKQIEVEQARIKAMNVLTKLDLEKLENESELLPQQEKIATLRLNVESKRVLQAKAWTYRASANALNCISALMTISGIANTKSIFDLGNAFTGVTGVFAITTALLQIIVMNLNKRDYEVKQNHFLDWKKTNLFKKLVIAISMIGNYRYMSAIMPEDDFYTLVSVMIAFLLDNGACYISSLATNIKYRNYTNDTTERGNLTRTDKLLALISNKLFGWIDTKYNAMIGENVVAVEHENEKPKIEVTTSKNQWLEDIEPSEKEPKKPTKAQVNYNQVMQQISTMKKGDVVSKNDFGLSSYDWKLVRDKLSDNKLVECKAKKTYVL